MIKVKQLILLILALNLALSITFIKISYADELVEKELLIKANDSTKIEKSAINKLEDAFFKGKFKGLLRYSGQHRDSNLHVLQDSSTEEISGKKMQYYSSLGGYLGYETAPWFNTSVGATVYTSNPLGNNPEDVKGLGGLYEGNGGQDTYTVLGEAFVKYQNTEHLVKLGRQEMPNYRFVSLSDVRMTPITHEGAAYENTVFKDFKVNLAYIWRMKERNAKTFINMADGARLKISSNKKPLIRGDYDKTDYHDNTYTGDSKEMAMASIQYQTVPVDLELWNYYVDDFVNTTYLYGQYDFQSHNNEINYTLAAQFASQNDVGSQIAGDINTWFYGLRLQVIAHGFTFFTAYNEVKYDEDSYDGGTIFVRWGTPQMFNSFQVQDSELAGEKSYGIGLQYDLGHKGIFPGMSLRLRYGNYNLPDSLSKTDARQDRTETTFDINYSFSKESQFGNLDGLSIQFRVAYNDYETDYDFVAYKENHGYGFESVTDDFVDLRLYLNYMF